MPGSVEPKSFKALLCDLDGTLVDSLPGIKASLREAIAAVVPELRVPDLAPHVGPPIRTMMSRLWPRLSVKQVDELVRSFRQHYDKVGWRQSVLYPRVAETLVALHENGIRLFVLTNKPTNAAHAILRRKGVIPLFEAISSPDGDQPFTRKRMGARQILRRYGLRRAATALVGDGADDFEAAVDCDIAFIFADYGYGNSSLRESSTCVGRLRNFGDILNYFQHHRS
jgi:phosphoglycolate phosphatase